MSDSSQAASKDRPARFRKANRNRRVIVDEEDGPPGNLEEKQSPPPATGPLFPTREEALAEMDDSDPEMGWPSMAPAAGNITVHIFH